MNFQNSDFDYVEQQHARQQRHAVQRPLPSRPVAAPRDETSDYAPSRPESPPPRRTAPIVPAQSSASHSTPCFDALDRASQYPLPPGLLRPGLPRCRSPRDLQAHAQPSSMERAAESERQMNAAMLTGFRDELAREAGTVTPGVVDTPYIQYAIEALTRNRDTGYSGDDTISSDGRAPRPASASCRNFAYPLPPTPQAKWQPSSSPGQMPSLRQMPSLPASAHQPHEKVSQQPRQARPLAATIGTETQASRTSAPEPCAPPRMPFTVQSPERAPVDRDAISRKISEETALGCPPLHFLPPLLRPLSFIALLVLALLTTAALIFCAAYSQANHGLVAYSGEIYGSGYFVFRILPQLLGAIILIFAQCIVATIFRIYPFVQLSSSRPQDRRGAVFQDLYPNWFLWPRLIGTSRVWLLILVSWLLGITLPLQGSLFTVVLVDDVWTWSTVQGPAWTLVALYVALLAAVAVAFLFWGRVGRTGLLWDPRCLADMAVIVSDTNTAADYRGTQLARTKSRLRFALRWRHEDRLGYWAWTDGRPGMWYGLGSTMDNEISRPAPDTLPSEKGQTPRSGGYDVEASSPYSLARHPYLPWWMRTRQLLTLVAIAFALVVALLIVSFLPSTHITAGFLPLLPSGPRQGAFSPADFLYSFLPSLLGTSLWLLFRSLDLSLRLLQPWAALAGENGVRAEKSLLADYAACVPVQSTVRAARNGHWRLAAVSLLSHIFILLPILGGGMFMALTPSDGRVRMYPNTPAFAIAVALLVLYSLALAGMLPGRRAFRLPHAVGCLAEIISFLANEDLLADPAFKQCRSRGEMLAKIGRPGKGTREPEARWMLAPGQAGGPPGIRRLRKFTEKRPVWESQIGRGDALNDTT